MKARRTVSFNWDKNIATPKSLVETRCDPQQDNSMFFLYPFFNYQLNQGYQLLQWYGSPLQPRISIMFQDWREETIEDKDSCLIILVDYQKCYCSILEWFQYFSYRTNRTLLFLWEFIVVRFYCVKNTICSEGEDFSCIIVIALLTICCCFCCL